MHLLRITCRDGLGVEHQLAVLKLADLVHLTVGPHVALHRVAHDGAHLLAVGDALLLEPVDELVHHLDMGALECSSVLQLVITGSDQITATQRRVKRLPLEGVSRFPPCQS